MSELIEIEPGVFQPQMLYDLYREQEQQLGAAYAIARGVWHWQAESVTDGTRLNSPTEIFTALGLNDRILVSDHDDVLGCSGETVSAYCSPTKDGLKWVKPDDYLAAVEKLGAKLKTP